MHHQFSSEETVLLRAEIELLMKERQSLLRVCGAAAGLIAELNGNDIPASAAEAAELLAESVNALSEETLQDALLAVGASIDE